MHIYVCTCGHLSQRLLSEPGFTGLQDLQDKRRGLVAVYVYACIHVYTCRPAGAW